MVRCFNKIIGSTLPTGTHPPPPPSQIAVAFAFLAYGLRKNEDGPSNAILAAVLIALILVSATTAYWQERVAADTINCIKAMMPRNATVVRAGAARVVPVETLVPGDVVQLSLGSKVPADCRVISGSVKLDNSSMTGESEPVTYAPERRSDRVMDARNVVFSSSLVVAGCATVVVLRTGDATVIGSVAQLSSGAKNAGAASSFEKEVQRFVRFVILLALCTAVTFFVIGAARGLGFVFSLVSAFILVLVANVPEGCVHKTLDSVSFLFTAPFVV